MRLIIVSGLSGSGKTIALHTLEDAGFYCVDNLPAVLLSDFVAAMQNNNSVRYDLIAVAVDARSSLDDMAHFENILAEIRALNTQVEVLFLTAGTEKLLTRFNETRRKHPLSHQGLPLIEAIEQERQILKQVSENANWTINTTALNVHELRRMISQRLLQAKQDSIAILIQSFGFKHGLPVDTDFMFDVRCLPNPHWEADLRPLTGNDQPVVDFLRQYSDVSEMIRDISDFLRRWIPCFEHEGRSYMTVSIGCTGGQHRSVYIANQLVAQLSAQHSNVIVRHRECG